jgi:hypothetical protein
MGQARSATCLLDAGEVSAFVGGEEEDGVTDVKNKTGVRRR